MQLHSLNYRLELTDSVVAHSSIQCPEKLQPYLSTLFASRPNSSSYYSYWPWRGASADDINGLLELVANGSTDTDIRSDALECIIQSQNTTAYKDLYEMAKNEQNSEPSALSSIHSRLLNEGYEVSIDGIKCLYQKQSYHIQFPNDYLSPLPSWITRNHKTWNIEHKNDICASIGGSSTSKCAICGNRLHKIINIEDSLGLFGVHSRVKLELSTCLSCLGWTEPHLFYLHDQNGTPHCIEYLGDEIQPDAISSPLKETNVKISPTPKRWLNQDWGLSNSRENLFRIGGAPSWIQSPEYL